LAEEFGRSYLQSATTGEDMSEIENADDPDPSEVGGPFLELDAEGDAEDESYVEETGGPVGGEPVDIPVDERGEPAPASEPPSAEIPPELEQGRAACPPDKAQGSQTAAPGAPARAHQRRRPRARG
jgi:hypothetical protein